jgi:FkbM family methyltransferase
MKMSEWFVRGFDRCTRTIQKLLGPKATDYLASRLGDNGTRLVRELLGRSPRVRAQVTSNTVVCGSGAHAWVICPDRLTRGGITYSFGVGNDITLDLSLIDVFGVQVFAFDPTPSAVTWIKSKKLPREFHFIEYGLADFDGFAQFENFDGIQFTIRRVPTSPSVLKLPVRRLQSITKELGHNRIELLKMNIEGGEYSAIQDMVTSNIQIDQLLIQFHHFLSGFTPSQTRHAVAILNDHGYRIFNISANGRDYSFMKT